MITPKCLEGVSLVALGAEGPMLYTIVEVNAVVLPLEAENAALRAEVARLSTWVDVDVKALANGEGNFSLRLWLAPCDCVCESVAMSGKRKTSVFVSGTEYYLDIKAKNRYLPITLPVEGK